MIPLILPVISGEEQRGEWSSSRSSSSSLQVERQGGPKQRGHILGSVGWSGLPVSVEGKKINPNIHKKWVKQVQLVGFNPQFSALLVEMRKNKN